MPDCVPFARSVPFGGKIAGEDATTDSTVETAGLTVFFPSFPLPLSHQRLSMTTHKTSEFGLLARCRSAAGLAVSGESGKERFWVAVTPDNLP